MRDSRQPVILIILSAVVVVGLAVSGFFIDSGGGGLVSPLWLSHALSLVAMLVTVLSLNYVNSNNFLFTSDSRLLYLPYMLAVLAVPGCNELSIHHAAAFLTVWAVYYALMYVNSETHRLYYAFMAALVSSLSAMLLPPMLYTGAFLLLYCLWYRGQDAARLLLAFVSALILPWVYVAVWDYIFHPSSAFVDSLAAYGRSLVPSLPSFSGVGWKCMIYFVLLSVMGMRAVVYVSTRGSERNKAQKNAFGLSAALSVIVLILELFFSPEMTAGSVVMAAVPFSFAVYDFLTNGRRTETSFFLIVLLLLAVVVRVSEFLGF